MDGGQIETEPPIGGSVPPVVAWSAPDREIEGADVTAAASTESGEWVVWVGHDPDLMIRVAIDAEPEDSP